MEPYDIDHRLREVKLSYLQYAARSRKHHLPELETDGLLRSYACECCRDVQPALAPAIHLANIHGRQVPRINNGTTSNSVPSTNRSVEDEMASNSSFVYPITGELEKDNSRLYASPSLLFPDNFPEGSQDAIRNFIVNDIIASLLDRVFTKTNPGRTMEHSKSRPRKTLLRVVNRNKKHKVYDTVLRPLKNAGSYLNAKPRIVTLGGPPTQLDAYNFDISSRRNVLPLQSSDAPNLPHSEPGSYVRHKQNKAIAEPDDDEIGAIDLRGKEKLHEENMNKLRNSFSTKH